MTKRHYITDIPLDDNDSSECEERPFFSAGYEFSDSDRQFFMLINVFANNVIFLR